MPERKSPLTKLPLRVPGQSLEDKIEQVAVDEYSKYITYGAGSVGIVVLIWIIWLSKTLPNPWVGTICGIIGVVYSIQGIYKTNKRLRLLRLGRDGERAVAEALDSLRGKGARVIHDIVAGKFNIDHVVLARRGIFAIETKTYTKYSNSQISYNGEKIFIGKWEPPKDPVHQASQNAQWLTKTLKKKD